MSDSSMSFLGPSSSKFGPRIGKLILSRPTGDLEIVTPGFLATTTRGLVPHLSRDHVHMADSIRWINIPFESFLEYDPPVPTLQGGPYPLHRFLGYDPGKHVLSMSARDPSDGQEMPPNGQGHIAVRCVRGVRKMMLGNWRSYTETCKPDFVVALIDIPFTLPPFSQRRIQKSIDRSIAWLADILRHPQLTSNRILVHMAGSTSLPARLAFSQALQEILRDKEAEAVKPLQCLDDGVSGYIFDLVPLRQSLLADTPSDPPSPANLVPLLRTSLETLPTQKLRIVNTPNTPHEILHLICHVGIDLFDAHWAERAAHVGVALDFTFPVREVGQMAPRRRISGKCDLGHNLYAVNYAEDYRRLAEGFLDGLSSSSDSGEDRPTCGCVACSPRSLSAMLYSSLDSLNGLSGTAFSPPLSRAYIHHLLNTHEMSSHSLLVAHNFAVVERFFENIRALLPQISNGDAKDTKDKFVDEMEKFAAMYDETGVVFEEAELCRKEVDLARGKGRLAREKARVEGEEVHDNCQ